MCILITHSLKHPFVRYEIHMKKIMSPGGTTVGLANGLVFADDKKIYSAESLKVGLFK